MQHPFEALRSEYDNLLSRCVITRRDAADAVARKLLRYMPRYVGAVANLGVPPALVAVLHQRESDADFRTYLGNGESLTRVTRLVPKGRGPWSPPSEGSWERGATDAIKYDRLNDNSSPWSMAYALWKGEIWNGFGPRNHGRHSGYLWAGTNIYTGGKYIADGVWSSTHVDQQLGIVPVLLKIAEIAPQFAVTGMPVTQAPSIVPAPLPAPEGLGGDVEVLQAMLNKWSKGTPAIEGWYPLDVDDSYGRITRRAVREFQTVNPPLLVDGLAGPKTLRVLQAAIAA